jgi:hypothetical protein
MARKSKAAIYAQYGIKYANGLILAPNGKWVRELLKEGNTKTGKKVLTFSLLPGKEGTCICNCPGCYAMTGFYLMPDVHASLERNTELVNTDLDFVRRAIMAQLEYIGQAEVRIHAAGDFNTADPDAYAAMWHDIAKAFPACRFWTYTKITRFETLFDDLDNANIVRSLVPEKGVNYGHCDYILELYAYLKSIGESVYICRCGIDKNQHCENCGHCSMAKYVLFIEHSTAYKAENDPLYETLKAVIDAQDNGKAA